MIGAPAIISSIELKGFVEGFHYCAKTGLWSKVFKKENTIQGDLKGIMRDNLAAPTDFAMDNLFSVDGEEWGGTGHVGGDPAGKDGIVLYESTNNKRLTAITSVHPTDPSGTYYRQWQGVLTNDFGVGSFNISTSAGLHAILGVNLTSIAGFAYDYADQTHETVAMAANDIFTVNWKITVG